MKHHALLRTAWAVLATTATTWTIAMPEQGTHAARDLRTPAH